MRFLTAHVVVLVSGSVVACAHTPAPTAIGATAWAQTESTSAVVVATDQTFTVGPNVRAACRIENRVREPKFDFNDVALSGNDREIAEQVASCFTAGPLKGRFVSVVAVSDRRGARDPGPTSAQQGVRAIKRYFTTAGVQADHITDEGREPAGPPATRFDRPIEVELAD
jgi:hypothetical protein